MKEKIIIEILVNTSPKILFPRLSTPSGLSEWFADDVNSRGSNFTFIWKNSSQKAKLVSSKDAKFVRFKWEEDEKEKEDYYFEFKIEIQEMSGDTLLVVTDFAEPDDKEDAINLWESQIGNLKHVLGL
ncbi:MAG: hypothetical protein COZ21_03450 [Bacteroidetes bacterium CG_4_10_14_3_um_filter_31_20]|nr:MAG: hypothetical protein COZ21_03450 [Bacteroidetes bacterium CG_4_10_14_3_um_filter_31_20]